MLLYINKGGINESTQITKIYLPKELFSIMIFMVMRMDCLFCKIVNNKVESKKIYEDDKVIAKLDLPDPMPASTSVDIEKIWY